MAPIVDLSTPSNWKFVGGLVVTIFMAGGLFYSFTGKLEAHEKIVIIHNNQSRIRESGQLRLLTEICRNTAKSITQIDRCNAIADELSKPPE